MSDDSWFEENTWTCSSCGKADNRGRFMKCEGCGSPKEAHEKYTMPSADAPRVTDAVMLAQARGDEHWECVYCNNQVRDLEVKECTYCGAPRNEKAAFEAGYKEAGLTGPTPSPRAVRMMARATVAARDVKAQTGVDLDVEYQTVRPAMSKRLATVTFAIIGLALVIVVGKWLFASWEESVMVSSIQWACDAQLLQRKTNHGEGWGTRAGAFNSSCERRKKGTENCNPHQCNPHPVEYKCNPKKCNCTKVCVDQKNGYSKCSNQCSTCYDTCKRTEYDTCYDTCPVYGQWCTYDYYTWPAVRTAHAQGGDHNMKCPALEAGALQRVEQDVAYEVVFSNTEDRWTLHPSSIQEFRKYTPRDNWVIEVNRAGKVKPLRQE